MIRIFAATLVLGIAFLLSPPLAQAQQPFRFIALADMPYGVTDAAFGPYNSLI